MVIGTCVLNKGVVQFSACVGCFSYSLQDLFMYLCVFDV
jgi:hypothetical protein